MLLLLAVTRSSNTVQYLQFEFLSIPLAPRLRWTWDLLGELHREIDVTILHITHSSSEAERLGETFLRLEEGKIIELNAEQ